MADTKKSASQKAEKTATTKAKAAKPAAKTAGDAKKSPSKAAKTKTTKSDAANPATPKEKSAAKTAKEPAEKASAPAAPTENPEEAPAKATATTTDTATKPAAKARAIAKSTAKKAVKTATKTAKSTAGKAKATEAAEAPVGAAPKRRAGRPRKGAAAEAPAEAVEVPVKDLTEAAEETSTVDAVAAKGEEKPAPSTRGRRRKSDTTEAPAAQAAEKTEPEPRPPRPEREQKKFVATEVAARGISLLEELAAKLNLEIVVNTKIEKNLVRFDIDGDDAESHLLGKSRNPVRLEALQTWLQAVIFESDSPQNVEISLDVNGFRARRTQQLDTLAVSLAKSVSALKKSMIVAGLNSFERRVVHRALEHETGIKTESEGFGAFRKLRLDPLN